MGELMKGIDTSIESASGWQVQSAAYFMEYMITQKIPSTTCIIPYVTEITICDGITNIGGGAFVGAASLNKIKIGNTIKELGAGALLLCKTLTNITIPNGVTNIERGAFQDCKGLTNITIPESVTSIGNGAFEGCTSLAKVKILATDLDSVESLAFDNIADNSVIYVLKEQVKAKLDETNAYNTSKTTVQVVTEEEMSKI